jgi:hypothetical protein
MSSITIHLRDGTKAEHKHTGRAGGSYTKTVRYEGGFAIVTDEWGAETAYPESLIAKVETAPTRW